MAQMRDRLKARLAAADRRFKELKEAGRASDKRRRHQHRQSKADRHRKAMLVGEAVLRRVHSGEWDDADFRQMMDEALSRLADRALFDLDCGRSIPVSELDFSKEWPQRYRRWSFAAAASLRDEATVVSASIGLAQTVRSSHSRTNNALFITSSNQATAGQTPVSPRDSTRTRAVRAPVDPVPRYGHGCIGSTTRPAVSAPPPSRPISARQACWRSVPASFSARLTAGGPC